MGRTIQESTTHCNNLIIVEDLQSLSSTVHTALPQSPALHLLCSSRLKYCKIWLLCSRFHSLFVHHTLDSVFSSATLPVPTTQPATRPFSTPSITHWPTLTHNIHPWPTQPCSNYSFFYLTAVSYIFIYQSHLPSCGTLHNKNVYNRYMLLGNQACHRFFYPTHWRIPYMMNKHIIGKVQ